MTHLQNNGFAAVFCKRAVFNVKACGTLVQRAATDCLEKDTAQEHTKEWCIASNIDHWTVGTLLAEALLTSASASALDLLDLLPVGPVPSALRAFLSFFSLPSLRRLST